ncbi:hypothetical protein WH50_20070 [Pokkaliibacter plantistimulans]|uniref:DUF4178 domain-containing protein n=1 Tax=Pokkaliibacter plantistimulans TaxID=1635171 RepID=A0ABX5LSC4_9GAMM|nr:hypothetical protein [Pokkaliibacter plantistimulans]PXF29545.1 hypothetical protein WH50_20070 [Pokkaliibacter plantistimulans]
MEERRNYGLFFQNGLPVVYLPKHYDSVSKFIMIGLCIVILILLGVEQFLSLLLGTLIGLLMALIFVRCEKNISAGGIVAFEHQLGGVKALIASNGDRKKVGLLFQDIFYAEQYIRFLRLLAYDSEEGSNLKMEIMVDDRFNFLFHPCKDTPMLEGVKGVIVRDETNSVLDVKAEQIYIEESVANLETEEGFNSDLFFDFVAPEEQFYIHAVLAKAENGVLYTADLSEQYGMVACRGYSRHIPRESEAE